MLSNLPSEIIVCIGCYLTFKDRLELSITCHRINVVITSHCLYQDLKLQGDLVNVRHALRKFKSKQFNGNQVRRLDIAFNTLSNQLYRRLPIIFPNLTRLSSTNGKEQERDDYIIEPMLQWLNKLEEYDMTTGQLQFDRLLLSHSFTRITSLVLSPEIDMLACLPNVPLLRYLTIFNFELDIDYLELLHEKAPKLTHFKLSSGLVRMMPDKALPSSIQPLVNLSSLTVSGDVAIADKECCFLDYISTKYSKINHFIFLANFKNALLSRHRSMRIMGGNVVTHTDFESTRESYLREGGSRFLNKLPNTITFFSVEVSLFSNIYTALAQSDLNPTEIHFHNGSESQLQPQPLPQQQQQQPKEEKLQLQYISKLINLKKLVTSFCDDEDPFTRDCVSRTLESLTLTLRRNPQVNYRDKNNQKEFDFGRMLHSFPNLKSLNLDGQLVKLTTNDRFTSRSAHLKLHKLELRRCVTLPLLVVFLRFYAKSIEHLEWSMTRLVKTNGPEKGQSIKTYEINLPDHRLKSLKLTRIPSLRPPQTGHHNNFILYVEVRAGCTIGKYTVETRYDDRIVNIRDITHQTIDLTCDVIDLTDLPEENENMTKLIITLRDLNELKFDGYHKAIQLHKVDLEPTIIDD